MYSSFNLGVAITAISIFISFFSFSIDTKFNLRFRLRRILSIVAVELFMSTLVLTFLAEFNNTFQSFTLQMWGVAFIVLAIGICSYVTFFPVKKITKYNVGAFVSSLDKFLVQRNQTDLFKHLEDITYFYGSLLKYSIKDEDSKLIFNQYLASNIFLTLFSEHPFLFEKTIHFYVNPPAGVLQDDMYHIGRFINNLFVKSLNNQNSFLNSFLTEDLYPNSMSYLDELFLNNKDINYSKILFDDVRFNHLSIQGQLSYLRMVGHYFKLVHRRNMSHKNQEGYEKKVDYNDKLIKTFFEDIKSFFESSFDQDNLKLLFSALGNMSWDYRWAVRTNDKSEYLRKKTGIFLYDVLHSTISKYKIETEDIFRLNLLELFDKYIEVQENGSVGNVAYSEFVEKVKEKIIGSKREPMSNSQGYYPAMIRVYFYIFGHQLFSGTVNDHQKKNLHLPILLVLKVSLPKLYNGFKQEFFDVESLPKGKEEKLQKDGRKIISNFLPENVNYDFSNNSLTYYYSGRNHGSRILLDIIKEDADIVVEKV